MKKQSKNQQSPLEFTATAIITGIIVGIIMTAANVYLGLYAGMTVSASIPAAVIAMGVLKMLKRSSILEANIVQTMASAGESLAAGIIFTVPALVLVGVWKNFEFWPTTLIAICGGILGVIFMIPLRKSLIIEEKSLTYPEGVACAAVLEAGASNEGAGLSTIAKGLGIGALFKFMSTGLGLFKGSVEWAGKLGNSSFFFGSDISPALLAVGYIVKLEIAILVFIGGAIGWIIGIPLLGIPTEFADKTALDISWGLWSSNIRYIGVGAMIVGGIWSIFTVRKGITAGLGGLKGAYSNTNDESRINQNMSMMSMLVLLLLSIAIMFGLYEFLIGDHILSIATTIIMTVISFLFVAVSSYIVGLVGSSNNPVSGMTISALIGTAAFFLVMGFEGDNAILVTLGVAAVVCCAACTSGDCSQDLKTGVLVGATPKYQQWAQIIGIVIPALIIAPVLSLLHSAYGIGTGLKAPQAGLFASITQGLFSHQSLPYNMIYIGMALAVGILIIDHQLKKNNKKFRLHVMPLAVGIYLPITLAVPMLIGGIIRYLVDKKLNRKDSDVESSDNGVLLGSGLIAGEAIMGVVLAIIIYVNIDLKLTGINELLLELFSIVALIVLAVYMKRISQQKVK